VEPTFRPSPAALAVVALLRIGPLHPYGMQRLLKAWGKDKVVNVGQRANLYKTIKRLQDAGLVAVAHVERETQYPERTVYQLTDAGRQAGEEWVAALLATPRNEFPEFPAAVSFLMLLEPDKAREVLETRSVAVQAAVAAFDYELATYGPTLPRVTLLETEYQRAVAAAELDWLTAVVADLRSGALTWNEELLLMAQSFAPD
jgi:DNA-binding PadR family transcriptional regulator